MTERLTQKQKDYWKGVHDRLDQQFGEDVARQIRVWGALGWNERTDDNEESDESEQKRVSRDQQ